MEFPFKFELNVDGILVNPGLLSAVGVFTPKVQEDKKVC